MSSIRSLLIVAIVGATATAVPIGSRSAATVPGGLPAQVVDFTPANIFEASYPGVDYGHGRSARDDRYTETTWRVVEGTGNCCENYVTVTEQGRLLDFGGTYINFSDDRGRTWKQVQPQTPLVNGEGTIVNAPDGDVLGVGWDPYSGDHLQSFHYEAGSGEWRYNELAVHQPFYDREWLTVVPGPVTIDGTEHPWVSFLKGGWPSKEVFHYSTDGLDYTDASSKFAEQLRSGATTSKWLQTTEKATHDWTQPNTNSSTTGLGGGEALAAADYPGTGWYHFDGQNFSWSQFNYPDGSTPEGMLQVDSKGRVHQVSRLATNDGFLYQMSNDGGQSWRGTKVVLPANHTIEEIDFRANAAAEVAAVGIHGHDNDTDRDQDLAYKLDIRHRVPRLVQSYEVGLGDVDGASGVGADVRFDFETIAIFADGRIAMSFYDTTTELNDRIRPALAIEQGTVVGDRLPPPPPDGDSPPALGTPYASYSFDQDAEGWTIAGVPSWTRGAPGETDGEDDDATASYGIDQFAYGDQMEATLTSPAVTTEAGPTALQFAIKHDTEQDFDYVHVEWSSDGANWKTVGSFTGQNAGYPSWSASTVGFDSPGGEIQVRFRFSSDLAISGLSGGYQGARVDSVVIGTAE